MKHLVLFISLLVLPPKISFSQQQQKAQYTNYIFDPKANAAEQLSVALIRAAETHKNLFIMVGGDWSYDSRQLHRHLISDSAVRCYFNSKFEFLCINFSPENQNTSILKSINCPEHLGYPLVIIRDTGGKTIFMGKPQKLLAPAYSKSNLVAALHNWAGDAATVLNNH